MMLRAERNWINQFAVKETCVTIRMKVVWIGLMAVIHFARCPGVNAHPVGCFIQPLEYIAGQSEIADDCHCRDPQKLVESSSVQLVLDAPVH